MYDNYFSNRIKITTIKQDIASTIPTGDDRLDYLNPNDNRIQRLQGFATRRVPNSSYVATSLGTNDFPTTKGQLVVVTNGYKPDESLYVLGDSLYNKEFTGDIRLLDGGITRIGQSFPPVGSLGYFAHNSIPDGWLEMIGQNVLFQKSLGFYYFDPDTGVRVDLTTLPDSTDPLRNTVSKFYEETIETEFTPLYNILASWGLAEISPSILGWNVKIPSLQGYYIRSLNPSDMGPDANQKMWYSGSDIETIGTVGTNARKSLNGSYYNSGSSVSDAFGNIPVVKHRHYGNMLHRSDTAGDKDWGITNFMYLWAGTRVRTSYGRSGSPLGITEQQDYGFLPYRNMNGTDTQNFRQDFTAGRPSGLGRKHIVGTTTQYIQHRYYPYHGWNSWGGVSNTNAFHDGYPVHGSKPLYYATGYTLRYRGQIMSQADGDEYRDWNQNVSESHMGYHTSGDDTWDMKYGRINSFIEHFHQSIWTYWHRHDRFSSFLFHAMISEFGNTNYHYWNWPSYHYNNDNHFWHAGGYYDKYENTYHGNGNYYTSKDRMYIYPYHIKKSPQGTAKESEVLNTANDGDQTTTSGLHSHSVWHGSNGVFFRGGYENRPKSVALRLCIKY